MILDTNALSALADGEATLATALLGYRRVTIPVVALGEFRFDIAQSRRRADYEAWLAQYLPLFGVLPLTAETTHYYGRVRLDLKVKRRPIPANDTWIAALALQYGLPVLSRDGHFDWVTGVERRTW
jgi:tRNA(fMet)-specific endonuclease VapC